MKQMEEAFCDSRKKHGPHRWQDISSGLWFQCPGVN